MERRHVYIRTLLLGLLGLLAWRGTAQTVVCPSASYNLTTQAAVNAFPQNCNTISGSLRVEGADITNLSPLSNIQSVGVDFWIEGNPMLTSLPAFAMLTSVGRHMVIQNNDALLAVNGFNGLMSTGEDFYISHNLLLQSVTGFTALITVGRDAVLRDNDALAAIAGLTQLTTVVEILAIDDNLALQNLDNLTSLTSIGRDLWIRNNAALVDISGLSLLMSIGRDLDVSGNPVLPTLNGLDNLTTVGVDLLINNNAVLTTLDGLAGLISVGSNLTITNNPQLASCCAIQDLLETPGAIDGIVTIANNASGCDSPAEITPGVLDDCPQNGTLVADANCSATLSGTHPTVIGCDPTALTWSINNSAPQAVVPGAAFSLPVTGAGSYTLRYATSGATSTCEATIQVLDQAAPTALCRDITVQITAEGNVTITAAQIDNGSDDNCGIVSSLLSTSSFNCDNLGPNAVTLTVTDAGGNSDDCPATVTVTDPESNCCAAPTAVCRNITVQLNAIGEAMITAAQVDGGSTAECGLQSLTISTDYFNCGGIGPNMVTLTITDTNGESDDCTASVTVEDTIDPTAVCKNITVQLNAQGQATIAENAVNNNSTDNCGPLSFDTDITLFNCSDVGATPIAIGVTLTVTDPSGNGDDCAATVTVVDNSPPMVSCSGGSVFFDGEDEFPVTDAVAVQSSDNCGVAGTTYAPSVIHCDQIGQNVQVVVTVNDAGVNVARCTTTVQVGGLPCGFADAGDIGCGDQVAYTPASGAFTLQPIGCNNSNPHSDQVSFLGYELCGNGTLSLRVASVSSPQVFAGISLRASLDPGAVKAEVFTNRTYTGRAAVRSTPNGPAWPTTFPIGNRYWLKLERIGNQVRIYTSPNGQTWTIQLVQNLTLPTCVQIGMVAYGPGTATFDNVLLNGGSLLAGAGPVNAFSSSGGLPYSEPSTVLSLYPNPTSGPLTLELPTDPTLDGAVLEIVDTYGRILLRQSAPYYRHQLDVSGLRPGTYYVRLQLNNGERLLERLVVQRP